MGNCISNTPMFEHSITVQTSGGYKKGTTNCTVRLQFVEGEEYTSWVKLDNLFRDDFELGQKDVFKKKFATEDLPNIIKLELANHNNTSAWACDYVEINGPAGKVFFPVYDWIDRAETYMMGEAKLCFHDHDLYGSDARKAEIEHSKSRFPWTSRPSKEDIGWGLPRYVDSIRHEQLPLPFLRNDQRQRDFNNNQIGSAINLVLSNLTGFLNPLNSFDAYTQLFKYLHPENDLPDYIDRWQTDKEFGRQQMNSVTPLSFKLCNILPKTCCIKDQHLCDLLSKSLEDEMKSGNIFIGDYSTCFQGVTRNEYDGKKLVCPDALCLYTVDDDDDLIPLAIQLIPDDEESVFTRLDEEYDWLLAKMFFKTAIANYHEWIVHFLLTHGVMEPVAVALFRCFPRCHPIYKLMRPHLQTVTAINADSRVSLITRTAAASEALSIEALDMTNKTFQTFHWDDLNVPLVIQRQGLDSDRLKKFYYRDDALKLWSAQKDFVSDILSIYYKNDQDVINDTELNDFITDLGTNGFGWQDGNLHGVPKQFNTFTELATFLTTVMFTSSAQHAAVNFPQYEHYKFIPNSPAAMRLPVHKKGQGSMERILDTLPDRKMASIGIAITFSLSATSKVEEYLGSYGMKLFTDQAALDCQAKYKEQLDNITSEIHERNKTVDFPYEFLLPERIPNSIAI